nr:MAG TPA: hypothetical protein [Caudoviricetes sp.]
MGLGYTSECPSAFGESQQRVQHLECELQRQRQQQQRQQRESASLDCSSKRTIKSAHSVDCLKK